jgi:hypothetical protein
MSVMHNNDQVTCDLPYLHEHKSLTVRSRSCYEWGSDRVANPFWNKCGQYVRYA